jgi:hypothetical protein
MKVAETERPPYPHFGSPTSQGMSPKAKRSRREWHDLAVSSSVLEPDGSFPAWTLGAHCRTWGLQDQLKMSRLNKFNVAFK